MAVGTFHIAVPVIASAAGVYFLQQNRSKTKQLDGGSTALMKSMVTKAKHEQNKGQMPKFTPAFDGLHCFETLVLH
ncbi:hypothetical protein IFM89_033002 [Coptis chinensis]|uniref:Uncharacterized protein n=1 Tax=Coptis chinensis TaxID=261450 RepID=A0A835II87_9MAGN|nr:hypothetical protein IFM89_033002 [Coptis chinensis]